MKKLFMCLSVVIVFFSLATSSYAYIEIDYDTGWSGSFYWRDLGQIDQIGSIPGGEIYWGIELDTASYIDFASAWDGYIPGDEFALYIDDSAVSWDTTYTEGKYFHGELSNVLLDEGTHTFTLYTTALAPGYEAGSAYAEFSGFTPASAPLPGAVWLMGSGLFGIGFLRRRVGKDC